MTSRTGAAGAAAPAAGGRRAEGGGVSQLSRPEAEVLERSRAGPPGLLVRRGARCSSRPPRTAPGSASTLLAATSRALRLGMVPNLSGYYRFVSQENMDNYLRALDINVVLRKVVCLLKPDKEIIHTGDHMVIRTITSLRDYVMDFDLGVQFEEDLGPVDGRKCQTTVFWEGDQLVCEQLGEKRNRGWRHWLEGDRLHLRMTAEDEVCVQVFQKVK
ncbi:retinol-binding protein 5 [Excalfactoria chinensis]